MMKTEQEIKLAIAELLGETLALSDVMDYMHSQRMEKTKQLFDLNRMLKDMQGGDRSDQK